METLSRILGALPTTQPGGQRPVSDIPASNFYWFLAIGGLVAVVLAWFLVKYAVLSALRTHSKKP